MPKCAPSANTAESRLQIFIFLCYFLISWELVSHRKSSSHSQSRVVCPPRHLHSSKTWPCAGQNQTRITTLDPLGEKREEGRYDSPSNGSAYRALRWNCSFKTFFFFAENAFFKKNQNKNLWEMSNFNNNFKVFIEEEKAWKMCSFLAKVS